MNGNDLATHFRQLCTELGYAVAAEDTHDGMKFGDPGLPIGRFAVSWKATFDRLRHAHACGCDFFVCHESLFIDGRIGPEQDLSLPLEAAKLDWLRQTGMRVFRCHDAWDYYPNKGVVDSWHRGLELSGKTLKQHGPIRLLQIPPTTLDQLAQHIVDRTRPLGQTAVTVKGDPTKPVERITITGGAGGTLLDMIALEPDVIVRVEDWFNWVREGELPKEHDIGLILLNHGTAEEWGIENLATYLRETFPKIETVFLPGGCQYRSVP